jgi:tetratricopeptide (TPR) repeat protein
VLSIAEKDAEVVAALADAYRKTDQPEKAIEVLVKADAAKEKDSTVHRILFELYTQTGKKKEAEAELKRLVELTKDKKYQLLYVENLVSQERYEEALAHVETLKSADPSDLDVMMLMGKVHRAEGKPKKALETYKAILFINADYEPAVFERAEVHLLLSELDYAQEYYEKALKLDPKNALAELGLAKVAKFQKKEAEYLKHLNRAKALAPKNEQVLAELQKAKK